ncbi:MAG: hypothetical protein HKN26_05230 [Acidimicrobiales bacterium]|nr:hypothetical protein [Acidimicrobiales bacterium]
MPGKAGFVAVIMGGRMGGRWRRIRRVGPRAGFDVAGPDRAIAGADLLVEPGLDVGLGANEEEQSDPVSRVAHEFGNPGLALAVVVHDRAGLLDPVGELHPAPVAPNLDLDRVAQAGAHQRAEGGSLGDGALGAPESSDREHVIGHDVGERAHSSAALGGHREEAGADQVVLEVRRLGPDFDVLALRPRRLRGVDLQARGCGVDAGLGQRVDHRADGAAAHDHVGVDVHAGGIGRFLAAEFERGGLGRNR